MGGISILNPLSSIKADPESIARAGGLTAIQAFLSPTGEPLRGYTWEVHILGLNAQVDALPELTFFAKSASIPESSIEVNDIAYMGDKFRYAGKNSSTKTMTLNFWDDQNLTVYTFFQNWMNTLSSPLFSRQVSKDNYGRTLILELRDTTDLFLVGKVTLYKAFITSLGEVNLDYDNSSIVNIPITLAFDFKVIGDIQAENVPARVQSAP